LSARVFLPLHLACLFACACAGSSADVQDARDVPDARDGRDTRDVRAVDVDPVGSLVRWIPEQADLLLFVDRGALTHARLPDFLDALDLDALIGGPLPASLAIGASVEGFVAPDLDASGRLALVFPEDGSLDAGEAFERHGASQRRLAGDTYRMRLPGGHFGIIPADWGEGLVRGRAVTEGSPADVLRRSLPPTGDPVVAAFCFVISARLRALIASGFGAEHLETLRPFLEVISSGAVIVQASAERFTFVVDVTARTPDDATWLRRGIRELGASLRESLFGFFPHLARHRALFVDADVRVYGARIRSRVIMEHRATLDDFLGIFSAIQASAAVREDE
jgi:hypothetical protein